MKIIAFLFTSGLLVGGASAQPATTTGTGSVRGSVTGENGKPVANAKVFLSFALPGADKTAIPYPTGQGAKSTFTDANGAFTAARMAPGDYVLCAASLQSGLLDPCHWTGSPSTFTLASGQNLSGLSVVMKTGGVLRVTLNDPRKLLPPKIGPMEDQIRISLQSPTGLIYNLRITGSADVSRDHEITLPFGLACTLRIESGRFTVVDSGSKAIDPAFQTIPVKLTAGAAPTVFAFTVTGSR